jgi:hypothetical protein
MGHLARSGTPQMMSFHPRRGVRLCRICQYRGGESPLMWRGKSLVLGMTALRCAPASASRH